MLQVPRLRRVRPWTVMVLAAASTLPAPVATASSDVLATQVRLTRAGFSVGVIDGRDGPKTRAAQEAWRASTAAGVATAGNETEDGTAMLQSYRISPEDAHGPFDPDMPSDMMAQARLESLPYGSIEELLAERFRTTPALLRRLNPRASFRAGETIDVPDVAPMPVPVRSHLRKQSDPAAERTARVRVSRQRHTLIVEDQQGRVLFFAPVSSGSAHDPLPLGEWKVVNVFLRPQFNYNPDLFWDASATDAKAKLPSGPNSPVGLVWIDLDKEHYGLHGTPEPEAIGVTQSHGCVRLTNWDALHVATLVKPGTLVLFEP